MGVKTRDMSFLRRKPKFTNLMKMGRGYLTDLSGRKTIQLDWNLNAQAKKDGVFKLTINGESALIDLEELTFYTRSMFK